jgi:hypothetical protein
MRPPTLSTTMTVARMRQRHAVGGASVEAIIDERFVQIAASS